VLNQVNLVGRLVKEASLHISENGKKSTFVTLAVPRSFKNMNGEYETDFIDCLLWENVAESTVKYCHKGDILSVRGRLQTYLKIDENDQKRYHLEVIAERVSFLSSKDKV